MLPANVLQQSQMTRAMKGAEVKMALQGTGSGFLSSGMKIEYKLTHLIEEDIFLSVLDMSV